MSLIEELENKIKSLEERFVQSGFDTKRLVQSEIKKRWVVPPQSQTYFGLFTCLAVGTTDPWQQNRVKFFSPLFHAPNTPVSALPWASNISPMGGFDDSGCNWVPPAGATLAVIFENGYRDAPYYLGTIWHRNRGPDNAHNWNYHMGGPDGEYYSIHEGHRKGYLVGANDGSQVLPPWNTESYNGYDINSLSDLEKDPTAVKKKTYPNIYGFKTPQKHMVKMVDGDYKCNHKNKRFEILSSCGNWLMFKDDHLHDCASWTPSGISNGPIVDCQDEKTDCDKTNKNSSIASSSSNPFFKNENELRPFKGPQTPQNNKCELPQTGIQLLSIAGHSFGMDDSVEEPSGTPEWERSTKQFDFGCSNKFTGRTWWVSATGHRIEMNDTESDTKVRGSNNYIRILSACGNRIELNDHTVGNGEGCPPGVAGDQRGIVLQSTSNHIIQMMDEENEQCSVPRQEGGVPIPKAKKAYVRVRSGYGLEITLNDQGGQQNTDSQYIQIFSPQKDNKVRGPHLMRFQEAASGPGQVFLRSGGDYICSTYDNHLTIVGDKEENLSNKITIVSHNTLIDTEEFYFNKAKVHALMADRQILLMAGQDCKPKDPTQPCVPCVWPVLCLSPKGITISDRVFASASPDAGCASIFQLLPFITCEPWPHCPPTTGSDD